MKLFTKQIDTMLFKQYPMGNSMEQKVVAKIFNPYGRGRWYLMNSDPNDPDYLWGIVQMGNEVEIGSISRRELENIRFSAFRLPLERDLSFSPMKAKDVYEGLKMGKVYKRGGFVEREANKDMLLNYAQEFKHHSQEFSKAAKESKDVMPWVIAKAERASTDLSDITHYLDGENSKYAKGGITNGYYETMANGGSTDAMSTVNEISRLTGLRPVAVAEWGDRNNINLSIILRDLKSKKIKGLDLMTAISGNEKNKYQKELLAKYSKMANGGSLDGKLQEVMKDAQSLSASQKVKTYVFDYEFDRYNGRANEPHERYSWGYQDDVDYIKEKGFDSFIKVIGAYDNGVPLMGNGGDTDEGVDLFEDYDNIPPKVQKVLDKYSEDFEDGNYDGLGKALKELNKIGYTFEFYLDGQAYDLRKIGQKGKSETDSMMAKGGMADGGEVYLIGKPEVDNVGRFNTKRYVYKSAKIKEDGSVEYGEVSFKQMGSFPKGKTSYGTIISTKDFQELLKSKKLASGGMMAKGGGVPDIDMAEVESSAKYYTDESRWSKKPTIQKFKEDIREYEELKRKLDDKEITPSKIIGTGIKPNLARPLAYRWLNERTLVAKRAIEILEERGSKMMKGGKVTFDDKVKAISKKLLERKKVSPSVQKDYGKTYSKKEAEESARRIVGAMKSK